MPANLAFQILVTLLVSLFPIALYCLMLAAVNRRAAPLLVHGAWDFLGVLFAASGILLWAGPAMLATLYQRSVTDAPRSFDAIWRQWWLVWIAYYGLILAASLLLLQLRRATTAIYNVQTEALTLAMATSLQRLGFDFAQNAHHQFMIASKRGGSGQLAVGSQEGSLPTAYCPLPPDLTAVVEIDVFPSMCHATLHWYETESRVRREIEEELRKTLADTRAVDNPAALWQICISVLLFGALFLAALLYLLTLPRHW